MFADLNTADSAAHMTTDIVIIGAGVNGSTLASALLNSGREVLLLDRGGDQAAVPDPTLSVLGHRFHGGEDGRRFAYGGTGTLWHGQCAPFDDIDFQSRDWIDLSGWPLSKSDLERWYRDAEDVLGINQADYSARQWTLRGLTEDLDGLDHRFSVFMPEPNVARSLKHRLGRSRTTQVLLHANVVEIVAGSASNTPHEIVVVDQSNRRFVIRCQVVVIAAGGIESARLMLASKTNTPSGLGNQNGNVGRYFQDHPTANVATIESADAKGLPSHYNMLYGRSQRSWARIALPETEQRGKRVPNAIATLVFNHADGSPAALKSLARGQFRTSAHPLREAARLALRAAPSMPSTFWRRFGQGLAMGQAASSVELRIASEQPPRRGSAVTLASTLDQFGQPGAALHWVIGEAEWRAQHALVDLIALRFAERRLGNVVKYPWFDDYDQWLQRVEDVYHHSGTTRMSLEPTEGVVSPDLQVFGVPRVYVCGSSVFPTSSSTNPTLTSVALTLRLAANLSADQTIK